MKGPVCAKYVYDGLCMYDVTDIRVILLYYTVVLL